MASSHNLIFLHGWGTLPSVWKHQVGYFTKNSPQYTVHSPQINKVDFLTSCFPLTIGHRNLQSKFHPSTILIGWSYGGMLAMEAAVGARFIAPDLGRINPTPAAGIKALALVGSSAKFSSGINPVIIKNLIKNLKREFEATMRTCYKTFFSPDEAGFIDEFVREQPLPGKKITIELLDKLATLELERVLKDISMPVLVIHGDKDEICPIEAGIYLNKNIKGSKLEIMKGAGHMPFYTRPHMFNRILEDFIESVK